MEDRRFIEVVLDGIECVAWARGPVGRTDTGEWFAEGPGVDAVYDSKGDAQQACEFAHGKEKE